MCANEVERYGPPSGGEQPHCSDCGSFEKWVCRHDQIKELHDMAVEQGIDPVDAGVPPGPWGYWACPNCSNGVGV